MCLYMTAAGGPSKEETTDGLTNDSYLVPRTSAASGTTAFGGDLMHGSKQRNEKPHTMGPRALAMGGHGWVSRVG